jgi:hypothetical protein
MLTKAMNKIYSWWMCLISKFQKKSTEIQFSIYAVVFILPICLAYLLDYSLNIYLFVYYIFAYFFFQIGFTMTRK